MRPCPECGRQILEFPYPRGQCFCSECLVLCIPIWTIQEALEGVGEPDPSWMVVPLDCYMPQFMTTTFKVRPRVAA